MRAANNGDGPPGAGSAASRRRSRRSSPAAVRVHRQLGLETYDLLRGPGSPARAYERFRRHALAIRARRRARRPRAARLGQRDELAVAALLHDVGRLVLARALRRGATAPTLGAEAPEERLRRERRELGIDHALVGAVLVRRWGLPAADRRRDRAPSRGRCRRARRRDQARRHDRPPRRRRPRSRRTRMRSGRQRPGARRGRAARACSSSSRTSGSAAAAPPSRARCRRARSTRSAGWPRARSTSRSPRSCRCR